MRKKDETDGREQGCLRFWRDDSEHVVRETRLICVRYGVKGVGFDSTWTVDLLRPESWGGKLPVCTLEFTGAHWILAC